MNAKTILDSGSPAAGVNVSLGIAALIYVVGWLRLHAIFPQPFSVWRLTAFVSGIASVWIAIGSPLNAFDDVSLTIHMVQHLLLMTIAPPLILLGAPALPILRGLPRWMTHRFAAPLLRLNAVKSIGRFLANPATCWLAAAAALIGWHIPSVFELALQRDWLHELEHATFLGAGLLFWWPVVQPWPSSARWPRWSIPLYLFCATLPCDVLSGFLVFCDRVVYHSYLSAPRVFGMSALQDQECAAALMWTCVTMLFLVPATLVTLELLSPRRVHLPGEACPGLQGISGQPVPASKLEAI